MTGYEEGLSDPAAEASLSRLRGMPLLEALSERMPEAGARAELAARLAEALVYALPEDLPEAPLVVEAARLQEVGKLYVDAALVAKPAAELDPEQRAELGGHFERGRALAFGAGVSELACELILGARERWDGSGPEGIGGEQIAVGARIVAVTRVYIDAGGGVEGMSALIERSGTELDPTLAAAAAELTAAGGF